ncbi:hypothetical protein VB739_16190 [Cyanobium gracile UHCC 0281]|uniref:Uncharacterized protein n=1 Tax=Cyanobium gracile UHCC 0281 TaxID=3110309 RepID=A0ABU5SZZ6_9CYAN|nr:hypothetical protein [Cyanobium gracile UHCC 0281]
MSRSAEKATGYCLSFTAASLRPEPASVITQIQDIYPQEYDLPVIGVILERLNAARYEVLARETSNKELVVGLSGYRSELKACPGELYDQPSPGAPALRKQVSIAYSQTEYCAFIRNPSEHGRR